MEKIVILYHSNCRDGFGAAWASWKKFGSRAEYIALSHSFPIPKRLKNKTVYMIDIVYPKKIIARVMRQNKKVIVLDHHKSAEEDTKSADEFVYDLKHSGAVLAWKYFHPKKPLPLLLKIIEESDLWKFKHKHVHELTAAIMQNSFDFKSWSRLARDFDDKKRVKNHIDNGKAILQYEDRIIAFYLERTMEGTFEGHNMSSVNGALPENLKNKLAHALLTKKIPLAILWNRFGKIIKVSIRGDGRVDVSKIAKKYGGGGHPQSSGFALDPKKPLPWNYKKSREK